MKGKAFAAGLPLMSSYHTTGWAYLLWTFTEYIHTIQIKCFN